MSLADFHTYSAVLQKQIGMHVILPDVGKGPFPVMYLLHGLSDDYTIWLRRSRIEEYVKRLGLIVVMPDGYRGFYTDNEQGPAFGRYMAEEVPSLVERFFPASKSRNGRCLTGLSMGGYGAFRLALAYPDRYCSAVSHSGAMLFGSYRSERLSADEFTRVRGLKPAGTEHDLMHLARKGAKKGVMPRLRFDCGIDDYLIDENRKLHHFLTSRKISHEYQEHPGQHDWDYWDEHVQEAISFHARVMKIRSA